MARPFYCANHLNSSLTENSAAANSSLLPVFDSICYGDCSQYVYERDISSAVMDFDFGCGLGPTVKSLLNTFLGVLRNRGVNYRPHC